MNSPYVSANGIGKKNLRIYGVYHHDPKVMAP